LRLRAKVCFEADIPQCRADARFTPNSCGGLQNSFALGWHETTLANLQRTFEGMTVHYARVDLAQCVAPVREQAERMKGVRHDQLSDAATIHVS